MSVAERFRSILPGGKKFPEIKSTNSRDFINPSTYEGSLKYQDLLIEELREKGIVKVIEETTRRPFNEWDFWAKSPRATFHPTEAEYAVTIPEPEKHVKPDPYSVCTRFGNPPSHQVEYFGGELEIGIAKGVQNNAPMAFIHYSDREDLIIRGSKITFNELLTDEVQQIEKARNALLVALQSPHIIESFQ